MKTALCLRGDSRKSDTFKAKKKRKKRKKKHWLEPLSWVPTGAV